MTQLKWYERFYITIQLSPFCWRLRAEFNRGWCQVSLIVGPLGVHAGWPDLSEVFKRDALGDNF